jgi:hypothetical protein
MRSVSVKVILGLAITSIAVFGADSSIGTWKRDMAKSKSAPPVANPVKSLTIVYQAIDGGVKVTATGERKDGTAINANYSVKYDGKPVPVTGATWDTTSMKRVDDNTYTFENTKTGGKYHVTGRSVISKDGKTMTTTVKGTNEEGKPMTATYIYDKQ